MSIRRALGSIRWQTISALRRRPFPLPNAGPTISFTFDDFPRSALHVGGAILASYDARGTYYAAMGLMDKVNHLGEHFSACDLTKLIHDGHELGSHTFNHVSCRSTAVRDFEAEVKKGRDAVEQVTGIRDSQQFSFPYGHVTLRAKPGIGRLVSSCRGTVPGINNSPVDLNLLRANSLYNYSLDLKSIGRLIDENEKSSGWLIFYTHDVSETPSSFGCRPGELESVVKMAVERQLRVLPVGQVIGIPAESRLHAPIGQ